MARVKTIKQLTNQQFEAMFPNEDACKTYLVTRRWPEGVHCPRCGNLDVYPVKNRAYHWQCSKCAKAGGYRFSVLVGTIFENTNKPLRDWFKVIHLMLTSKKGMSSLQIMRYMGFGSYKTALYMCNRIRAGLSEHRPDKLAGVVGVIMTAPSAVPVLLRSIRPSLRPKSLSSMAEYTAGQTNNAAAITPPIKSPSHFPLPRSVGARRPVKK
jgi:transposase-like protein